MVIFLENTVPRQQKALHKFHQIQQIILARRGKCRKIEILYISISELPQFALPFDQNVRKG